MSAGWLALAIVAQLAAAGADLATTHRALASGRGVEGNPVMRGNRAPAVKVAVSVSITAGSVKLWRSGKHKQAIVLNVIPAVTWGVVAVRNQCIGGGQ